MKNDSEEKIEINKSQDKEYLIPCVHCHVATTHKVLLSSDMKGSYIPADIQYWEEHQIVQCLGCKSISFRKNSGNSEDCYYIEEPTGDYTTVYNQHEEIFPSRIAGRQMIKQSWNLPSSVLGIYKETHTAIANKLPVLAGVGIRSLIEAICHEKNAKGNNLKEKIDDLVTIGTLTKDGSEILHTMRNLGNEAAHSIRPQEDETLGIALDVVENVLQSVYILPLIAKKIKNKTS